MWPSEWVSNRERMYGRLRDVIEQLPRTENGPHLNLGCGPKTLPGFINIDKYHKQADVQNFDFYQLPYQPNSVSSVYSSHSLEHLPIRLAKLAVLEWGRVLRPGGRLFLAIPDLEETMKVMLDPSVPEEAKWNWFVYVLFGFQTDPEYGTSNRDLRLPVDPGQFHTCGFTKRSITDLLLQAGLKVTDIYNYDGWNTPSIWVEACKS